MAFVVACWGYSPTGIHIGLQAYDPGHLALLRFLMASVFMAVVAAFMGYRLPRASATCRGWLGSRVFLW